MQNRRISFSSIHSRHEFKSHTLERVNSSKTHSWNNSSIPFYLVNWCGGWVTKNIMYCFSKKKKTGEAWRSKAWDLKSFPSSKVSGSISLRCYWNLLWGPSVRSFALILIETPLVGWGVKLVPKISCGACKLDIEKKQGGNNYFKKQSRGVGLVVKAWKGPCPLKNLDYKLLYFVVFFFF